MNGKLILRIARDSKDRVRTGAVVDLQRIPFPDDGAYDGPTRLNVSLTPEQGADGREIELPRGRWFVEATLGTGDVVSEMLEMAGGGNAELVLPLPDMPLHEWLRWQFDNGNIEGRAAAALLAAQAKEMARKADERFNLRFRSELLGRRLRNTTKAGARRVARGLFSLRNQFDPEGTVSRGIGTVEDRLRRLAADRSAPVVTTDRLPSAGGGVDAWLALLGTEVGGAQALQPVTTSLEEKLYVYRPGRSAAFDARRMAVASWDGERYALLLPDPWLGILDGKPKESEVLVRKHPLDNSLRVSVAVLDPDFATLSALMMTAAMPKAAVYVEENADRIFAGNSLAEAAAAYIALSSGRPDEQMLARIRAFERSGFCPDCFAVAAWRMMRFPHEDDGDDFRDAILRAAAAGPPYFSMGVSWVLDALTMLDEDDEQARVYLQAVKQVAIRLDTAQVFTTVR